MTRWYRARWFHLVIGLAVAALAVVFAGQRAAQGVRDGLDARLRAAGAGANAALVTLEAEQLSALRAITFTQGVPRALEQLDVHTLNRLVTPLQANSTSPMVDVVLPSGRVVLAVRSVGAPAPVASRAGLPALGQALRQAEGNRGGRLSAVVSFKSGPTFLTIGPVMNGRKPVGAVLVMTPLADALGRLSQQVGADLTAYDAGGVPIATTADFLPKPIDRDSARTLIGGGSVVARYVRSGHREALGRLIVGHQAATVLGVSLVDDSDATESAVDLYAALGLVCTVVILASFWARVAKRRSA